MALSRILIVKLSSLGDVIHALPVAGALRRRFPRARITWLVGPAAKGIVTMCRHVDRVITWAPGKRPRLDVLAELRGVEPQVCLDLQGLIRTACIARLSGARWRIGFRTLQEGGFPLCNLRVISARTDVHAVDGYLAFARYLDADGPPPDYGLHLPPAARDMGARMAGGAPTIALLPGTQWETKKWPARHFAGIAASLGRLGLRSVVLGGGGDREAGAGIAAAAPNSTTDLTGRTSLAETAAIIADCSLVVGNDSGPMHLAAALKVPVVALFGPTDPVRTGPYGDGHTVLQAPVPCLRCRRRRCPVSCMEMITPDAVLEAVRRRLGSGRSS